MTRSSHFGSVLNSIARWSEEAILPLYLAWVQTPLEFCVSFWAPLYEKSVKVLESVHATKQMKGLEGMSCGALGSSHLERRWLRCGLPVLCNSGLCSLVTNDRMWSITVIFFPLKNQSELMANWGKRTQRSLIFHLFVLVSLYLLN